VILLMFGDQWIDAAPALSMLSVFGAYLCIEKINQAFCLAAGKAKATALVAWAEVSLSALIVWLVASLGMVAMVAALVFTFLIMWPVRFGIVAKVAGVNRRTLAQVHLKPLLASILMVGVVQAWMLMAADFPPLAQVASASLAGIVVIASAVRLKMRARVGLLAKFFGRST